MHARGKQRFVALDLVRVDLVRAEGAALGLPLLVPGVRDGFARVSGDGVSRASGEDSAASPESVPPVTEADSFVLSSESFSSTPSVSGRDEAAEVPSASSGCTPCCLIVSS